MMRPPPSAYQDTNPKELEAKLAPLQGEIDALEKSHAERMARWQSDLPSEDVGNELADWERAPSAGPILGVGYIRADPPADVAAQLAARRDTTQPTPPDAATRDAIAQINQAHGVEGPAPVAVPREAVPSASDQTPVAKKEDEVSQPNDQNEQEKGGAEQKNS